MFGNSFKPDQSWVEGTVTQVDVANKVCRVITARRQSLDSVRWSSPSGNNGRGGDRAYPSLGDRVCITFVLGYPLIAFYLDRMETALSSASLSIAGTTATDTGNYAPTPAGTQSDPNQPPDSLSGDRILASSGGSFLGLLRTGGVLLRAGKLAEIFMSRLGDLVRIVSRNFEHFHSAGIDVVKNYKGQVYRYQAYTDSYNGSASGTYKLRYYYGNTAAAEAIKDDYLTASTAPSPNGVIFKEVIDNVYTKSLSLDGTETITVTGGGTFTTRSSSGGEMSMSFGGSNTMTINGDKIHLNFGGNCEAKFEAGAATVKFGGSTVVMNSGGITVQAAGSFSGGASGGMAMTSGSGGSMGMDGGVTELKQSGHGVRITGGGVELF